MLEFDRFHRYSKSSAKTQITDVDILDLRSTTSKLKSNLRKTSGHVYSKASEYNRIYQGTHSMLMNTFIRISNIPIKKKNVSSGQDSNLQPFADGANALAIELPENPFYWECCGLILIYAVLVWRLSGE